MPVRHDVLAQSECMPLTIAPQQLTDRIAQSGGFPPMPEMAQRVLQLRANPYADIRDLARIVELDPSLAAQVIRYARSPFFGYRGEVHSIHDAVSRVLGYDMTMNVVMGIAVGRPFTIPSDGALGLTNFWRGAVHCAAVCQILARSLPLRMRPSPGLAYLSGMVHNFGLLLLGHLFASEFSRLNEAMQQQPGAALPELEQQVLGITHMELGALLMEHWGLHAEVVSAVRWHHDPGYEGVHAIYPNLVLLANRLLQRVDIGEAEHDELPPELLQALGVGAEQAAQALATVMAASDGLERIAGHLAA